MDLCNHYRIASTVDDLGEYRVQGTFCFWDSQSFHMNAVYSSVLSICSTQFPRLDERDSKRSVCQTFSRLRTVQCMYMLAL
jgi:hypothetical protein